MNQTIDLSGRYKLKCFDYSADTSFVLEPDFVPVGWLDTTVPEDVRTALRREGLITGHYYGKKLNGERWIDEKNWIYYRRFYADNSLAGRKNLLRFEGIDTLAEIYLNGEKLGLSLNMFLPCEFDVSGKLRYGATNILVIRVLSPVKSIEHVSRAGLYPEEDTGRLLLRKSQMNYGWDFCGHCLTTGLWKSVSLQSLDTDRLGDVFLHTQSIGDCAEISVHAAVQAIGDKVNGGVVRVRLLEDGREAASLTLPAAGAADGSLSLPSPKLWWPRPYGNPFLYEARVTLEQGSTVTDCRAFRFGVRTVRLLQEPLPEGGRSFLFEVNGKKLFIRGANWVPLNSVYGEIRDADYDSFLRRAEDANLSMLRVWGGGIYESEHFFDLCDEKGILVMQDFMLACGVLPQEQWFLDQVSAEVDVIARHYRNRASLVIWSGDNELDEAYRWYDLLPRFKTNKVNRIAVQNAIREADPTRPFLVSSPCSPFGEEPGGDDPNSPLQGDMHIYLTRFQSESEYYYRKIREFVPRFMSEYGFSSLPCRDTVERFNFFGGELNLTRNPWLGELPEFDDILRRGDTEELVWATQYTHAQALKYGIEYMRCHKWTCGGVLYWKFNDPIAPNRENMLFPGLMSSVDFFGKPKMAYYYSRRAYEDVILAFREEPDGTVALCACNETEESYTGVLTLRFLDFSGKERTVAKCETTIPADRSAPLYTFQESEWLPHALEGYLKAEFQCGSLRLVNRYMPAEIQQWFHVRLPDAGLSAEIRREKGRLAILLACRSYAQDVQMEILDADAYYSDNCIQMDAGEQREIRISLEHPEEFADRQLTIQARNSRRIVVDLNPYLR